MGGLGVWVKAWDLQDEQTFLKAARNYEEFVWRYFMSWSTAKYNGKDMTGYSKNNPFKDD